MSLINQIQQTILRSQSNIGSVRLGLVTSSNPLDLTIKVMLQPEQTETGFIPYGTPWIGWFAPPSSGDQAIVLFQEADKNVPIGAFLLYWNESIQPPSNLAVGEVVLQHSNGSLIKLGNDGKITIHGNAEVDLTAPTISLTATSTINLTAPAINIGSSGGSLEPLLKSDSSPTTTIKGD